MNTPNYWYWNNYFNEKEIIELNEIIKDCGEELETKEQIAKNYYNSNLKICKVKNIIHYKIKNKLKTLIDDVHIVNENNYGYNLFNIKDKQYHNLNIYSSNVKGKYDWHTDKTKKILIDIKFTVLINLSMKNYEGGQFELFENGPLEVKELLIPGNVIMFKSYMNHRVLPVLKGERRTLAIFFKGPNFI